MPTEVVLDVGKLMAEEVIPDIRFHCAQMNASRNGSAPILHLTFEEIRERWQVDLRSDTEGRHWLYSHRLDLIRDDHLFFDADTGRGLFFTVNDAVGFRWFMDMVFGRTKYDMEKAALVSLICAQRAPDTLEALYTEFEDQAKRLFHLTTEKHRAIRLAYEDCRHRNEVPPWRLPSQTEENGS